MHPLTGSIAPESADEAETGFSFRTGPVRAGRVFYGPTSGPLIGHCADAAMLACGHSPMTRTEFVQRLVLDSICDDFKNVDQVILRDVAE